MPAWSQASEEARTSAAIAILGIWEYMQRAEPAPHRPRLVTVARQWVSYRLQTAPVRA
ncbi:hypothetical protein [Haloactinomyces albus]|uniref:Uncharacterized protein n=1 Tax=Haloactinomyces albus TaxID=1352928 RepID=A0AAE3ZCK2_9ACTN|nr:hypothetical protein [Haloactinomyces albus]MDR7301054.1 hypothetical protein [Haloactinomyces albus]